MGAGKHYLVHEYKNSLKVEATAIDTTERLMKYLRSRGTSFPSSTFVRIGSGLVTLYAKDGTKFEVEELPDPTRDDLVRINGRIYVSLEKYCKDTGKNRRDVYRSYHLERRKDRGS